MSKLKSIVLLAVLGLAVASCTKENVTDDTYVVATASSVTYFIDGQQYYANPQTDEEWSAFLDRMLALAKEGYTVRFERTGVGQQTNVAKEKVTYITDNEKDAKLWAAQMVLHGYQVTITFDQTTGKYTCVAVR